MSLLNLPTEILQEIVAIYWNSSIATSTDYFNKDYSTGDTLRHQQQDFGNLALVCRRLAPLVQKQLFQDVVVSSNPWPGKARFERFNAVLRSSPLIRSYVESIRLTWFTDRWEVSDMVNGEILLQLQSLRNLVLKTDSPGHCKVLDFMFLDQNPMPRLRSLEICGPRMTYEAALRLVQKPGLATLRLGRCEGYEVDRDRLLAPPTGSATSLLASLDTTDSVLLDIELRQLLSHCVNLSTLVCNLPRHLPEEDGDRPLLWQYRTGVPASRQRLSYCLEPVSVSLLDLKVGTVREDSREAPAPDLTFLVSLRRLKIDAACLWPSYITPKDQERKNFYKCLPPSLEELEVSFLHGYKDRGEATRLTTQLLPDYFRKEQIDDWRLLDNRSSRDHGSVHFTSTSR